MYLHTLQLVYCVCRNEFWVRVVVVCFIQIGVVWFLLIMTT